MEIVQSIMYFFGIMVFLVFIAGCTNSFSITSEAVEGGGDIPYGNSKGFRAPDFTVTTTDGEEITLREITAKGKPVVVYFMATWCPYCAEDLAAVNRVYPKYKDLVDFVAIDLDLTENADVLALYKKQRKHDFPFAPGYPQVLTDYAIRGTTAKFAISKEGVILYSGYGALKDELWKVLFEGIITP